MLRQLTQDQKALLVGHETANSRHAGYVVELENLQSRHSEELRGLHADHRTLLEQQRSHLAERERSMLDQHRALQDEYRGLEELHKEAQRQGDHHAARAED